MLQVNDCFYCKDYSSVYIVRKVLADNLIEIDDLFAYKGHNTRCSYAVHSVPRAVKTEWLTNWYVKIDPDPVFRILKLLRLNNIACEAIIKRAPILQVSSVYFYRFDGYFCIGTKKESFNIGDHLLCVIEVKRPATFQHLSLEVFREIKTIVTNNFDLIDNLWNSFSELKANG